jgi:ABC-2 type transport system permease protein
LPDLPTRAQDGPVNTPTTGRLRGLWQHRQILWTLVRRDLRVRYARSVLGYLWTVLDPLAMALIYFVIFAVVFQRPDAGLHPYFLFLLVGLLAWQWFNASITETSRALLAESKLVRSTNLPRELWVIRVVIAKGIEYLLSLPILVFFVAFYVARGDTQLNWRLVLLPLGLLLQFLFQVGFGLLLAPVTVLVEDTQRVVRIILRMLFYATPIIYSLDKAPDWLRTMLYFNPMSGVLELYRAGLFEFPLARRPIAGCVLVTVLALSAGWVVFRRLERPVLKEI